MRRLINIFLIAILCSLLTSCFDVIEEITVNSDGSFDVTITFNFSKSKVQIASTMLLDSINGVAVPKKNYIDNVIDSNIVRLKNTAGISQVSAEKDWDEYIFIFKAHADNTGSLNQAVNKIKGIYRPNDTVNVTVVTYENNIFKRVNQYSYNTIDSSLVQEYDSVISGAMYTSVYRFPKEVKTMSNIYAKLSPNKKAIMFRSSLKDIIENKKSFENTIYLQE